MLRARPVLHVERDAYCQRVLALRFPGVPLEPDIERLEPDAIPDADLWCGGFPCQDISPAGKGAGIHGERSRLWREWARLITAAKPPWVLIENHPALRRRGLDVVLADLHAAGYDARWLRLSAWDVGAWHWRERLWIAAGSRWTWAAPGLFSSWTGMLPRDGVMVDGHVYPMEPVTSGKPPKDVPRLLPDLDVVRENVARIQRERACLPTATAGDAKASGSRCTEQSRAHPGVSLTDAIVHGGDAGGRSALPTAEASDWKSGTGSDHGDHAPPLSSALGGLLNPGWEEPFMGFPVGWTDLHVDEPRTLELPAAWLDSSWLADAPPPTVQPRIVEARRQRVHALGNAVVPQAVERAAEMLLPSARP